LINEQIFADVAKFRKNPYGFVMYVFPWGDGELAEFDGPEDWQKDILQDIGQKLEKNEINAYDAVQIAISSGHGIGKGHCKSLELNSLCGGKRWGDLKPGDDVIGSDGKKTKILQTHELGEKDIYRVTFDDGSYTYVTLEHLWNVRGRQYRRKNIDGWETISTEEILNRGVKRSNGAAFARQWEIPIQGAVDFEEPEIDIHPYFVGLWLGDGTKGQPQICKPFPELVDRLKSFGLTVSSKGDNHRLLDSSHLFRTGVFLLGSDNRFIPENYKYNSIENRMELFRGLCDSDGEVHAQTGTIGYSTTSKKLADDVIWLARSLGCKAQLQPTVKKSWYPDENGNRVVCKDCYRVTINSPFNPFTLKHRKELYSPSEHRYLARWIESIEFSHREGAMCITVANEDGLYLANDFIVTHNSALVSWIILWALSTHEDTKGVVTANTEVQLKTKTWAELAKWYRLSLVKSWFTLTATSIYINAPEHEKTWRFDMVPWSKEKTEAFAGMHNKGKRVVVIFDEASAIIDEIWEVTEGALTDENTEILWLVFGNPTRNTGRFHGCFNKYRHRWDHKQIDARSVRLTNKEQIRQWETDYGEDSDFFRVRVKGEFPSASDHQFIPSEFVNNARGRFLRPEQYNFAAVVIGVDRAWSGSNDTKIYLRQGLMSKKLATFRKDEDDYLVAGHLARFEDEYKADAVFIDFGYGTGLYSAGKQMGREWRLVQFGGRADNDIYANKRAEMWGLMKQWLKDGGSIPDDQDMVNDLIAPEAYSVQTGPNAGKLILESKEVMQKRGIDSPDDGDALALTFAFPVLNKSQAQFNRLTQSKHNTYNPLTPHNDQPVYNPLSPLARVG